MDGGKGSFFPVIFYRVRPLSPLYGLVLYKGARVRGREHVKLSCSQFTKPCLHLVLTLASEMGLLQCHTKALYRLVLVRREHLLCLPGREKYRKNILGVFLASFSLQKPLQCITAVPVTGVVVIKLNSGCLYGWWK